MTDHLYHGTSASSLRGLQKHGLCTAKEAGTPVVHTSISKKNLIYVTPDLRTAEVFAKETSAIVEKAPFAGIILRVEDGDVPKDCELVFDPYFEDIYQEAKLDVGALSAKRRLQEAHYYALKGCSCIPPEKIEWRGARGTSFGGWRKLR